MSDKPRPEFLAKNERLSTLLSVLADLSGTIATFLPMKSVFILASEDIPWFFPGFLQDGGPLLTAIFLLAVSVIFAAVHAVTKSLANSVSSERQSGKGQENRLQLSRPAQISLIAILTVTSAIFSWLFTLLVVAWVSISVIGYLALQRRRETRAANKTTLIDWLNQSSLWVTVVAAIVTLLVSEPFFGLTAILLDSVLLMRLQRVVSELVGGLQITGAGEEPKRQASRRQTESELLAFCASPNGKSALRSVLTGSGSNQMQVSAIGRATNNQVSFASSAGPSKDKAILRIFSRDEIATRDTELQFRKLFAKEKLMPGVYEGLDLNGHPAIKIVWKRKTVSGEPVSQPQIFEWQLKFESICLSSSEISKWSSGNADPWPWPQLLENLQSCAKFEGHHTTAISGVIENFETLRERVLALPLVPRVAGGLNANNFVLLNDGHVVAINLGPRSATFLGFEWSNPEAQLKQLERESNQKAALFTEQQIDQARLGAAVAALTRAAESKDFAALARHAKKLSRLAAI